MTSFAAAEAGQRDQRADRHADQGGQGHGGKADEQRQPDDPHQGGIGGQDQLQRGGVFSHLRCPSLLKTLAFLRRRFNFCSRCNNLHMDAYGRPADHRRGRRVSPAERAQALRTDRQRRLALHQGHRPLALSEGCARPLARLRAGDTRRHVFVTAPADRRRQPGSVAGLGVARQRLRPCQPAGRQRSGPAPLVAGRGDGGGDPSAPSGRRRRDRQHRDGRADAGPA